MAGVKNDCETAFDLMIKIMDKLFYNICEYVFVFGVEQMMKLNREGILWTSKISRKKSKKKQLNL